jgi:hypothetical protein
VQSKATTVAAYLAELPPERRAAIGAVRDVIRRNLDQGFAEGMYYGMIMYFVPHSLFPAGYHCDPSKPLGFVALASQKQYMSLYLDPAEHAGWFETQWAKSGKKLDKGKVCIRFKRVDDLALDVVAQFVRRVSPEKFIESYLAGRLAMSEGARSRKAKILPASQKTRR